MPTTVITATMAASGKRIEQMMPVRIVDPGRPDINDTVSLSCRPPNLAQTSPAMSTRIVHPTQSRIPKTMAHPRENRALVRLMSPPITAPGDCVRSLRMSVRSLMRALSVRLASPDTTTVSPRTSPLIYGQHGDDYLVVASKGGADEPPAWYVNLREHPEVEVQVGADRFSAHARTASEEEKGVLWPIMTAEWPAYDEYQTKTSRPIPVVVLERR